LQSKRRFYKNYPKIGGVITDILYDHLLCLEWEKHTDEKLSVFIKRSYDHLDTRIHQMPSRVTPVYSHMRAHDWFSRYQTIEGTALSLMQIGERMGFGSSVGESVSVFKQNEGVFIEEFNLFFHEIKAFSKEFLINY
jgi:acyl carrier protein phosphodiesterase